mgnify:CR=1 FL=1
MVFRFLHIHGEAGKCYITGCFERCTEPEEKEILKEIVDSFQQVNSSFQSSKVVLKDNTVFFRGVDSGIFFSAIKFLDSCLELSLTYRVGKNVTYTGDRAKELFDKALKKYSISVI